MASRRPRGSTRALLVSLLALAAMILLVGKAQALTISGAIANPESTQISAHSRFHLHLDIGAGDDLKDLTFQLPAGQTPAPSAQPTCSSTDFNGDTCPANTQVADATAVGDAGGLNDIPVAGAIYNLAPQPGEPGRLGLILRPPVVAAIHQIVTLSQRPDSGFNMALAGIPNSTSGTHVHLDSVDAVFYAAFINNPATCSAATTTFLADGYSNPAAQVTTSASYTPTGCVTPPPPPVTKCTVPNLLHKKLIDAKAAIRNAHCAVGTVTRKESSDRNRGRVIGQSPSAGKRFAAGRKVNLTVGK